jgi:hypothetical protein
MTIYFDIINPYNPNIQMPIFYPVTVLKEGEILSPVEVLETYRQVYGYYPERPYTLFSYKGINYIIERSSTYGNVKIGHHKYLVTPTTVRY